MRRSSGASDGKRLPPQGPLADRRSSGAAATDESQYVGRRVAPSNQRLEQTGWRLTHHGRAPCAAGRSTAGHWAARAASVWFRTEADMRGLPRGRFKGDFREAVFSCIVIGKPAHSKGGNQCHQCQRFRQDCKLLCLFLCSSMAAGDEHTRSRLDATRPPFTRSQRSPSENPFSRLSCSIPAGDAGSSRQRKACPGHRP
jgi:hypothetical protein